MIFNIKLKKLLSPQQIWNVEGFQKESGIKIVNVTLEKYKREDKVLPSLKLW